MKAQAVVIFAIIMLFLIIAVIVPFFMIMNSTPSSSQQGKSAYDPSIQLQGYQVNEVLKGNPFIYYNSSSLPYIRFYYYSTIIPFNITSIMYFHGTWSAATGNIIVSGNYNLYLPKYVQNYPILIITSLGNIFLLNPNTSVIMSSVISGIAKPDVAFIGIAINGSKTFAVSINIDISGKTQITPVICEMKSGTYILSTPNSTIFLPQYSLTGKFENWTTIGRVSVSDTESKSTELTVFGTGLVTIVYLMNTQKYPVTISQEGIILENNYGNSPSISSLNASIPISIDNITYSLEQKITVNLTYGYHIIVFPSPVNITYNYTLYGYTVKDGEIDEYKINSYNSNYMISKSNNEFIIYVNSSGYLNINYGIQERYYLVEFKNNFQLIQPYSFFQHNYAIFIHNTSPVYGDIAGQLLQLCINGKNETFGPINSYQLEKVYLAQGSYNVTYNYLFQLNGNFTIEYYNWLDWPVSSNQTYQLIISYPIGVDYGFENPDNILGNGTGNYTALTVNSPLIVVDNQCWKYGVSSNPTGSLPSSILSNSFNSLYSLVIFPFYLIRKNKGQTNAIAFFMLLIIVIAIGVPLLLYESTFHQNSIVQNTITNNYVTIKNDEYKSVTLGHPSIYYNYNGSIDFLYVNSTVSFPINLEIRQIDYFTNGIWRNLTTFANGSSIDYPITVTQNSEFSIPKSVSGDPIVIISEYGNMFYLVLNSSIGPMPLQSTKGGVIILSQIQGNKGIYTTRVNITTNIDTKKENFTTPVTFTNDTGSFFVDAPEYAYAINASGFPYTGYFHNWIVLGNAKVNSTKSSDIEVTLEGSGVSLIANYTLINAKINLTLYTNATRPIYIGIDGHKYQINGEQIISVTAGYVNLTELTPAYNITKSTEICTYGFDGWEYGKTYTILPSILLFIPPNSTPASISIYYEHLYNYYTISISNNISYNPVLTLNSTTYSSGSYWIKEGMYNILAFGYVGIVKATIFDYWGHSTNIYFQNYTLGSTIVYIDGPGSIEAYWSFGYIQQLP
ncbi:hypothetical protein [Acidianus brierleyi]|uniref:hypothetical protein n=1 Tax=Acidianus brierleyi TaxID=41673 RepID=UPI00144328D2|nr:hypothetical protein [Acidianus brierleyi]AWR94246.2 hypothetical protein DFR85_06210 [Acidianus brierleyi]